MECGHLETALFLMKNTVGIFPREEWKTHESFLSTYFQDPNLRKKCAEFLANQAPESLNALKDKYPRFFKIYEDVGVSEAENGELEIDSQTMDNNIIQIIHRTEENQEEEECSTKL